MPRYVPTDAARKQVEAMAGYGLPELQIAVVVGIDAKTLRKYFRHELDLGHAKANTAVAQSLFRKATGDGPQSVTAAIFWCKTRMGWKETNVTEHTGPEGGPVTTIKRIILTGVAPGARPEREPIDITPEPTRPEPSWPEPLPRPAPLRVVAGTRGQDEPVFRRREVP